jgi:hypothetical protein
VHKNLQINTTFWDFSRFFTAQRRNIFLDSNFPKSYLLPIRGYSWHKNEIKRIRRGCYRGKKFQDSTKEKILKENMGYLLRVLFFNAFQLGAERIKYFQVKKHQDQLLPRKQNLSQ